MHRQHVSSETVDTRRRKTIDIATGLVLVFIGMTGAVAGILISAIADRDEIAQLIADDVIQTEGIRDAAAIELLYGLLLWGGYGLTAASAIILIGAIIFTIARWRSYRRGTVEGSLYTDGVVGAVITSVTSFLPFAPLIGGLVAGFLYRGDGWRGATVGVVVGILVMLPVVVFGAVLAFGYIQHELFVASLGVVFVVVVTAMVTLVFAAVGGYIGGYLRAEHGK